MARKFWNLLFYVFLFSKTCKWMKELKGIVEFWIVMVMLFLFVRFMLYVFYVFSTLTKNFSFFIEVHSLDAFDGFTMLALKFELMKNSVRILCSKFDVFVFKWIYNFLSVVAKMQRK